MTALSTSVLEHSIPLLRSRPHVLGFPFHTGGGRHSRGHQANIAVEGGEEDQLAFQTTVNFRRFGEGKGEWDGGSRINTPAHTLCPFDLPLFPLLSTDARTGLPVFGTQLFGVHFVVLFKLRSPNR